MLVATSTECSQTQVSSWLQSVRPIHQAEAEERSPSTKAMLAWKEVFILCFPLLGFASKPSHQ